MLKWVVVVGVALWAVAANAADQPRYAPPADWVKPLPIPDLPVSTDGSAIQFLLQDVQARLGSDADEFYVASAIRILTPQGLAAFASLSQSWRPDTETLVFHRLNIMRGGKIIDLLDGGKKVVVLRRETNLDLAMLDGALTATVQPEGLQVGDVVDSAVTLERRDPVMEGRSEQVGIERHPGVAGRVRYRTVWPDAKPVRWLETEGLPKPVLSHAGQTNELVIDMANAVAPKPPRDAPARFQNVGELELTQFQSWAEVSALMAPHYARAETLAPASPLRQEVARIRQASSDPKTRAEAALRLVEDQVHYVALNMNSGGYIPADADLTWSRRFGDCKGKSVLLIALLRELGVEAEPALVNTKQGDALQAHLPMLGVFDHVIVRATLGGKVYWLDGTRIGDRGLDDIPVPDDHWVLPVSSAGGQLERVEPPPYPEPTFDRLERLDASAGYDAPAPAHVELLFRGDDALGWHIALDGLGHADAERQLREYWRSQISWVDAKTVDFAYDAARHIMRLSMDGVASMDWTKNGDVRDFQIADSNLGFTASFKREPGPHADAPFAVNYPDYDKWTVIITLPNRGAGFHLIGAKDTDQTIAGRRYSRHSRIENGLVTMVAEEQSLVPEFPASDADAASAALRDLNAWDVTVRGPIEGESAEDDQLTIEPTDAAGFNRRAVAYRNRGDFAHALADFSAAVRLEPKVARHLYNRGAARVSLGQGDLALRDFNDALRLDPHDALARMARGEVLLANGDEGRAKVDFDQAVQDSGSSGGVIVQIAQAYDRAGRYERAVREYDLAIGRTTAPQELAILLNARCWAKAEWGHELESGASDCDRALTLLPDAPNIYDSRGFVRLRLGQYDQAIADYDAALRLSPRMASSLYGRGLAKLRKGQTVDGRADLAAARAAVAGVAALFARYGVDPPADTSP